MNLNLYLSSLREKGYLAYEYNPFHNYQTDVDLYKVTYSGSTFIIPENKAVNPKNGNILNRKTYIENYTDSNDEPAQRSVDVWIDQNGNIIDNAILWDGSSQGTTSTLWASAGSLIDFETDKLNFDLDHPVDIEVQPSQIGRAHV